MGSADRAIRLVIAAVVAFLYFKGVINGVWGIVLLILAVVFFLTSIVSFCPIYKLLGINTCKRK